MDTSPKSSNLNQQAIDAALDSKWELALKLNKQIIRLDSLNIDALNRMAKAYIELGKGNLAKKFYSEVLKIDPYNPIALKNLKIIKSCKPNGNFSFKSIITLASGPPSISTVLPPGSWANIASPCPMSKAVTLTISGRLPCKRTIITNA